ncbi:MAG: hypothetical protein ACFCVK_07430 [Acidimicrobiales bacterium]
MSAMPVEATSVDFHFDVLDPPSGEAADRLWRADWVSIDRGRVVGFDDTSGGDGQSG